MARAIFIYGPPGSGKTRNAQALARHYGKDRVVDEWHSRDRRRTDNALVLTQERVEGGIPIAVALRAAGIKPAGGA